MKQAVINVPVLQKDCFNILLVEDKIVPWCMRGAAGIVFIKAEPDVSKE